MGKYLSLIKDLPIDGPVGQKVMQRLAIFRSMGVSTIDVEAVAKAAIGDVEREQADLVRQIDAKRREMSAAAARAQEIQSSDAPVMEAKGKRRVITLPSKVTLKASAQPAPTLVSVVCPKCGREKELNPDTQQPIEIDVKGRRFASTVCPKCGATFKAQLPAEPMQASAGDLPGGFYLTETEAALHPWR